MLRVGFDVDGVFAYFEGALEDLLVKMTGKNLFPPRDPRGVPVWNWAQFYGYTDEEVAAAFKHIAETPGFWFHLEEMPHLDELRKSWHDLYFDADVYFVTNRAGISAKTETEAWLETRGIPRPTVLISGAKGDIAKALKLDYYIDDHYDNAVDVFTKSPTTKNYLLNRTYNEQFEYKTDAGGSLILPRKVPAGIERVHSVSEFLARVGAKA